MLRTRMGALTILMLPVLLTLSFFVGTATLAEGASTGRPEGEIPTAKRIAGTGGPGGLLLSGSTSAVTGSLGITGVAASDIGASFATVSWETEEPSVGQVNYGTDANDLGWNATSTVTGTAHSVGLTGLTSGTQYFYTVEATDAEGDLALDDNNGAYYSFTTGAGGSLIISDVAVGGISATSAEVTWASSDVGDSLVRYGLSAEGLNLSATSALTGTAHAVGLANLTPDTQYFFEVESGDGSGDPVVDNNSGEFYAFTTLAGELKRKAFVGIVVGDPAGTVTLSQNGNKGEVTIILPDGYVLKTPGGPRAGALEDGARVVILSQRAEDQWVALQVLVHPLAPNLPVVGVVTGVGPTSLTVLDRKGVPHFLRLDGEEGYLEPGAVVTMFPGNSGQAKGLVRAEDVRERMQSFLERTPGDDGMGVGQGQEDINGKRARALIKGLEKHGFEQVRLLDMALDRVPEKEKEKIELRKAKAQRGIDSSKTAINKARNKFHLKASSDDHGDTVESNHEGGNNRGPGGDTSFVRSENRPAKAGNASGTREKPENPGNSSGKETDNGGNRGDRPEKTGKSNKP